MDLVYLTAGVSCISRQANSDRPIVKMFFIFSIILIFREDEMVGYHHQLDGHEFEHALGVGDGQRILAAVHGVSKSWTGLSD